MAFGRDGSELELEVDRLQKSQYKTAIERIVEIVKQSTASIIEQTEDPQILKIANNTLQQVIATRNKFFPVQDGLQISEQVEWKGAYVSINLNEETSKITSKNSKLPFEAALIIDFSNRTRETAISVFDDILVWDGRFEYERSNEKGMLYKISGEFTDKDTTIVTVELFQDIENVTGFKTGVYHDIIGRKPNN